MPSRNPTTRALLEDPVYRAYMKKVPPTQHNISTPPWQMWIETPEHKWLTGLRNTYVDAWKVFVSQHRAGNDPTITSRRVFYAPPGEWYKVKVRGQRRPTPGDPSTVQLRIETRWRQKWFATDYGLDLHWCGRCRRPVYWMPLFSQHHALRRFPAVTEEDNYRCTICGIRWIAQPDIDQMVRIEAKP